MNSLLRRVASRLAGGPDYCVARIASSLAMGPSIRRLRVSSHLVLDVSDDAAFESAMRRLAAVSPSR